MSNFSSPNNNLQEKIPSTEQGEIDPRLDRWIRRQFGHVPQSLIERLLKSGKILVNGKKEKSSYRVKKQDSILVNYDLSTIEKTNTPIHPITNCDTTQKDIHFFESCIIFEDDELIVINKPNGIATQGGSGTTYHIDGLVHLYATSKINKYTPRLVHRLDKETSGILIITKSLEACHIMQQIFFTGMVEKTYWAICNDIPPQKEGVIDMPIRKDYDSKIEKMITDHEKGKKAITHYRLMRSFHEGSFLELKPKTGRTHQLRVHLQAIGCPIRSDSKYGKRIAKNPLFLHAYEIFFMFKNQPLRFFAPPPPHWDPFL
jgi:23S rRNA pseudouridine955/2504/2580 synthase